MLLQCHFRFSKRITHLNQGCVCPEPTFSSPLMTTHTNTGDFSHARGGGLLNREELQKSDVHFPRGDSNCKDWQFCRRHRAKKLSFADELEFRRILYCIPTKFFKMDSVMKRYFKAMACRRQLVKQGRLVQRSASQIVDEIMSVWRSHLARTPGAKCTAVKIMDMYKANLGDGDADLDDPDLNMSAAVIRDAMIIQESIKDIAELNLILHNGDDALLNNSPFFIMKNLAALAKKHKTTQDLSLQWKWC